MLSNKLDDIYLNFQKMDCKILSLVSNIMSYLKYDVSKEWYYVMGNGTQLEFPFLINEIDYFKECFDLIEKICYFSGAWNTDYLTQDKKGFLKALKYKWLEWQSLKQNMPFIIGRCLQINGKADFYVLIHYDTYLGEFVLIDDKGMKHNSSPEVWVSNADWLGFSAIDVPNNFLVKSKFYRDPYKAGENCLIKMAICLLNRDYMINILKQMAYCADKSIVEKLFLKVAAHCKKQDLDSSLNRYGLSTFFQKQGYQTLSEQYSFLANDWKKILEKYYFSKQIDTEKIKNIAIRELECIHDLRLCKSIIK